MTAFFEWIVKRRWGGSVRRCARGGGRARGLGAAADRRLPDVTNIQVMVLSKAADLSATDVEQRVTYRSSSRWAGCRR